MRIMKKWVEDIVVARVAWGCRNVSTSHQSTVKMKVVCIPEQLPERRNNPSRPMRLSEHLERACSKVRKQRPGSATQAGVSEAQKAGQTTQFCRNRI